MAVKAKKKATKKKRAAAKTKKRSVAKKSRGARTQSKIKKGSKYQCGVCGIAVKVDEVCGCIDVCDIICCGEQMMPEGK